MIRRTLFSAVLLAASGACAWAERPNILIIMSDDQGIGDIGYMGNEWASTPVLDALALESANLVNFIAAPACTPSRAAYLTGRNYTDTGVWGVGPRGYIRRDETFLPEYLKRAGYRTAHFGKWGEGWTPDQRAYSRGYEVVGALGGGYQNKNPWMDMGGKLEQKTGWTTDILADMTIDFIREQAQTGQPWYAITAYIAPHEPWECDPVYSDPLLGKGYSPPLAAFYGMVRQMDAATGRILSELEKLGQSENTIVIFLSDNGPTPHDSKSDGTPIGSKDWERRNALGLRGSKAEVWQNALRVPCLVRWPGKVPAGERGQFAIIEDLLPTILDLADVEELIMPDHLPFLGISLKKSLLDPDAELGERYVFRVPVAGHGAPRSYPELIIEDPTKLRYDRTHLSLRGPRFVYHNLPDGTHVLYDLVEDPGESRDASPDHPELTGKLARQCREEWDKLIASGRGFWMPSIQIADPRYSEWRRTWAHLPPNIVPCNVAQEVTGTVTCPFPGLTGFSKAGDSATFALEVLETALYEVTLTGSGLDQCAPLLLQIGDVTLEPLESTGDRIEYGRIEIPSGAQNLIIKVEANSKGVEFLKEIAVIPVERKAF